MKRNVLYFLIGVIIGTFFCNYQLFFRSFLKGLFIKDKTSLIDLKSDFRKLHHLGIIMDGNRRWAKANELTSPQGHEAGAKKAASAIEFASQSGIKFLSLYVFSIENLERSEKEKEYLFGLITAFFNEDQKLKLKNENIKVFIIGDYDLFPKNLLQLVNEVQEITKNNTGLTLALLFCYGGKQELVACCKKLLSDKKNNKALTIELFQNNLWSKDLPDIDLLIRTGGRSRISNFLPWQTAYAEIQFIDLFWPDVDVKILKESCEKFMNTSRSFGH